MTDKCIVCLESLEIQVEDEEDCVYDDVELVCRHHIHYDCARDLHAQSIRPLTQCPECGADLLSHGHLLVTIRNEGGITERFDLGEDLEDQKEITQDPALARNEAFLSFCFAQDHEAMRELLEDGANVDAVQRKTGMTGLHLCALNNDPDGVRLLLQHGASRDIVGLDGTKALDVAFSEGSHDAAYALQ